MKKIIFITNLPSFYKTNLFNKINENSDLLVLYTHENSSNRNSDFFKGNKKFKYKVLSENSFIYNLVYLKSLIKKSSYDELIIGGWDLLYFWIALLFGKKNKNSLIVESSIFESKTTGVFSYLKKIFLKKVSKIYVSGSSQKKLCETLGFKGEYKTTLGVGIFNIIPQPKFIQKEKILNFVYVGRLSEEKNLLYLIETFNKLPTLQLNIIGFGPLEKELKEKALENISFLGAINNTELTKYYQKNDVFILPSYAEPWGMVVEEALNNGLPVIVSNNVGCAEDLIKNSYGVIFNLSEADGLKNAINKIRNIEFYNQLTLNISKLDFFERAKKQVNLYLD